MPQYWLIKSEPHEYSIDDLKRDGVTMWDGVRNYQARNYMRDNMKIGDRLLFYHSNTTPPAIVGVAEVVRESYPDYTAWDPENSHFDPKSTPEKPIWIMVDVAYRGTLPVPVTLKALQNDLDLEGLVVARKGNRLSVSPVSEAHYRRILAMGDFTESD